MTEMFEGASSFNQDLTGWCVSQITVEPNGFATNSALTFANKPLWGKEFTIALTSGSQTQTVTATTAITPIQYTVSSICTTTLSVSASNLPSGVSAALSNNIATISGTPAGTATGTFNYSLTVSGSSTGQTVTGTIIVSSSASSTTASSSIYFDNGTCKCPNASVGDTATISGTLYTVVDNSTIASQIANGNYNLCTTLATYMTELFVDNTSFNSDISFWDMSNVTNTDRMFQGASSFNQDIGGWNTSKFYDVSGMFKSASNFNQNIGSWDTSRVANMSSMFNYASSFNQDLTGWCVSNISSEPGAFAANTSALTNTNKPLWGYCPASFSLDVTASNSSDYTLSGTDRNGNISGSDPNLTFSVGDTISFVVNASGHPFYLKTVAGTGTGDTISGLTNNGTESATISWTPTATGTFYYQCSLHGGMVGTITIQ
jgi:surface protein